MTTGERIAYVVQRWTATLYKFLQKIANLVFSSLFRSNKTYSIPCKDLEQFFHTSLHQGPQTVQQLKSSLQHTPNCSVIYHMIQNNPGFDEEWVSNCILEKTVKLRQSPEKVKEQLVSVLKEYKHIQYLKEKIIQRQATSFDHDNPQHEETLFKLWDLLLVSSPSPCSRKSEEWKKLGFQGLDPCTDFRGGGLLALQQLVYFAETRRELALQMLKEASDSYPFACVGIHCTAAIVQLVHEDYLDMLLYACSEEQAFKVIHERYCELWIRFHRSWKNKTWEDIMSFQTCFQQQVDKAKQSIAKYGYITETDE